MLADMPDGDGALMLEKTLAQHGQHFRAGGGDFNANSSRASNYGWSKNSREDPGAARRTFNNSQNGENEQCFTI